MTRAKTPRPGIGGFFEAFQTDGESDVPQFGRGGGRLLVDEGAVGEDVEDRVLVLARQSGEIVHSEGRLSARDHDEVNPELFRLAQDPVEGGEVHVLGPVVFTGPAAFAAEVAAARGIDQHDPGDVDPVGLLQGPALGDAEQGRVEEEVDHHLLPHAGRQPPELGPDEAGPVVLRIRQGRHDDPRRPPVFFLDRQAFAPFDHPQEVLLRIPGRIAQSMAEDGPAQDLLGRHGRHLTRLPSWLTRSPMGSGEWWRRRRKRRHSMRLCEDGAPTHASCALTFYRYAIIM